MTTHAFKNPRRIVVGTNEQGRSYFATIEEIEEADYARAYPDRTTSPGRPASAYWRIWGSDHLPFLLPTDGKTPPFDSNPSAGDTKEALRRSYALPPPLGMRVTMVAFAPNTTGHLHWHDSVEVFFSISGELIHVLDTGDEVTMRPGDFLIQNGTIHAWHNRSDEPATVGIVVFGGIRIGASPPQEALSKGIQRGSGYRSGETG